MTLIILLLDGSGLDEAAVEAVLLDAGAVLDATGAVLLATGAVLDAAGALLLAATLLDELTAFELLAALDELTELLDELTELELLTGFSLSELAAALSATLAEALSSLAALWLAFSDAAEDAELLETLAVLAATGSWLFPRPARAKPPTATTAATATPPIASGSLLPFFWGAAGAAGVSLSLIHI